MIQRVRNENDEGKKRFNTYICPNHLYKAGCNSYEYSQKMIENLVFRHLKDINLQEILNENSYEEENIQAKINLNELKIGELEKKKNNIIAMSEGEDLNATIRNEYIKRLNAIQEEMDNIINQNIELNHALKSLIAFKKQEEYVNLKKVLELIDEKKDDYDFRIDLNNKLKKFIEKIVVVSSTNHEKGCEIEETDREYIRFKESYTGRMKYDEIVKSKKFEIFLRNYNLRIDIHYKFGVKRSIFGGDYSLKTHKRYSFEELKHSKH